MLSGASFGQAHRTIAQTKLSRTIGLHLFIMFHVFPSSIPLTLNKLCEQHFDDYEDYMTIREIVYRIRREATEMCLNPDDDAVLWYLKRIAMYHQKIRYDPVLILQLFKSVRPGMMIYFNEIDLVRPIDVHYKSRQFRRRHSISWNQIQTVCHGVSLKDTKQVSRPVIDPKSYFLSYDYKCIRWQWFTAIRVQVQSCRMFKTLDCAGTPTEKVVDAGVIRGFDSVRNRSGVVKIHICGFPKSIYPHLKRIPEICSWNKKPGDSLAPRHMFLHTKPSLVGVIDGHFDQQQLFVKLLMLMKKLSGFTGLHDKFMAFVVVEFL